MSRLTYKTGSGKYALLIDGKEHTGEVAERLAAYENFGEPTRLMRRKPARPKRSGMGYDFEDYACPHCGKRLALEPEASSGDFKPQYHSFCCICGQAIDWSELERHG